MTFCVGIPENIAGRSRILVDEAKKNKYNSKSDAFIKEKMSLESFEVNFRVL